ncbi:glycosyltransferase [Roseivivax isoporae]|uniref:Glycosyltransferase 2-like domain-containing protein n=1 Tax=Roseivivax isoporae LMG 25204 TaxID=1449351 RepID=X7F2I9_9RHOB|nr:glycosyltransferase [Roseivivax isoporae]ETX26990.1 hypothetical protein RISW2_17145 [Roseivivax isoporae LMG 25204]
MPDTHDDTDFDPVWYLHAHPDVARAGMDPRRHYDTIGRSEGRLGAPVLALELDHMLWRGYAEAVLGPLTRLLATGRPRERAAAGWALARWHRDQGDPAAARTAIAAFHATPDPALPLRHAGPWLLDLQLALEAGDGAAAATRLADIETRFGATAEAGLAALLAARAAGDTDAMASALGRLHPPAGLAALTLAPGDAPAFDRVVPRNPPPPAPPEGELPLVSVIVPVLNGAAHLDRALSGLTAQDWPALEILVVDDGSSDESRDIAAAHARRDPRVRPMTQGRTTGAYPARNAGLAAARGAFVTVHDADDWSHPAKIRAQVQALLDDPGRMASVSHWVRAGDDLDMTLWRIETGWVYRNVSSLMIRTELRDILGFWDRVRVNADTEYYYRIHAAFGPGAIVEVHPGVPLAFGRSRAGALTARGETDLRTHLHGLRNDYLNAARAWHARTLRPAGLHLPEHPPERPFRVPKAVALTPPDPEPEMADRDRIAASDMFDPAWYRLAHRDVLAADLDPAQHYLEHGARENRDPGPAFSTGGYRHAQGLGPDENPLLHWERTGRAAGADPLPGRSGALADRKGPRVLVFAHQVGRALFGAERSLLDMLDRFLAAGEVPVAVVPAMRNPDYLDALAARSAAIETVPQLWRFGDRAPAPATCATIARLIARHAVRKVHVNTLVLDAPLAAARAAGCESVVHVRELPENDPGLCRGLALTPDLLRTRLLNDADRFVANSGLVARWIGAAERTEIRPNAVSPALFDMPFAPGTPLRVALVSSNTVKKGVAEFVEVARRVAEAEGDVRFLLIGPPTPDLRALQPFPHNVDFADYAETPEAAIAQADVVMSLSRFSESFGRTVLEAMAAGRPVICWDRGAPPELVESGVTGFVVPADDCGTAANAVLALAAARTGLARMSDAARARAARLQARATGV